MSGGETARYSCEIILTTQEESLPSRADAEALLASLLFGEFGEGSDLSCLHVLVKGVSGDLDKDNLETHLEALIRRWEAGVLDPADALREIRTALAEEKEIQLSQNQRVQDERGRLITVGTKVIFGGNTSQVGAVFKISDYDADVDDNTGFGVLIPPRIEICFPDGTTEVSSSTPHIRPYSYDGGPWVFEATDCEVIG